MDDFLNSFFDQVSDLEVAEAMNIYNEFFVHVAQVVPISEDRDQIAFALEASNNPTEYLGHALDELFMDAFSETRDRHGREYEEATRLLNILRRQVVGQMAWMRDTFDEELEEGQLSAQEIAAHYASFETAPMLWGAPAA